MRYLLLLIILFSIGTVQAIPLIDPIENISYRNIVIEKDGLNSLTRIDLILGTIPLDFFNAVFPRERHNDADREKIDKYKEQNTVNNYNYLYSKFENIYFIFFVTFPIIPAEITFTKGP